MKRIAFLKREAAMRIAALVVSVQFGAVAATNVTERVMLAADAD